MNRADSTSISNSPKMHRTLFLLAAILVIGGIVIVDSFDGFRLWGEMINGIGLILAAIGLYFYGGFLLNNPPVPRAWSIYMAVMARVCSVPALIIALSILVPACSNLANTSGINP